LKSFLVETQHKQGCVGVIFTPSFSAILYQSPVVHTWEKLFHHADITTFLVKYCFPAVVTTLYFQSPSGVSHSKYLRVFFHSPVS
jgi:hypothetical protein